MKEQEAKLVVAGCGDAFGSGGNHYSCYALFAAGRQILIDCGATAVTSLKKLNIDPSETDLIIVSHFHGDHYSGLPFIFLEASIIAKRKKKLHVLSPPGIKKKLRELTSLLYPGSEKILESFPVEFHEYEEKKQIHIGGISVTPYPVKHSKKTLPHGLRIAFEEKILAFSGDTGWTETLVDLASGADVFLCECNNLYTQMSSHLDYQTLSGNLERLNAKRTYLTHFGSEMVKAIDEGKITAAVPVKEGMVISI